MALSSAPTSITRLWIRISYLSHVLVPWPAGDFLVTTLSFFVGRGCGPRNLIPDFSPIPFISLQTPSSVVRFVLVSLILAAWGISIVHFFHFLFGSYLSVMLSTTPAPIVVPISRSANLPISGKSLKVSIGGGLTGLILTIAASPVLRNLGFCSVVAPVLGSIFETNCEIVAATCAVCACKTGVYPGAIAVGWWITIRRASNSLATDGGLAAAPIMSPRLICFLSTPLRLKPTLSPASADSS